MGEEVQAAAQDASTARLRLRIVSGPISPRAFLFWGALLFAAAIFHGHQLSLLDRAAAQAGATQISTPVAPAAPSPAATTVASPAAAQPAVSSVQIRMMKYAPATLQVAPGSTVEWKNDDLTPHTVTSTTKQFDSGAIAPGATWRRIFPSAGEFPYVCTFHPEMKGAVIVK